MITLFIAIGVCAIIGFLIARIDSYEFIDLVGGIFFGSVVGFVIGGFTAGVIIPTDGEKILAKTYKIVTLQDGSSIYGNFTLGCGTIDGTMKYIFYYESDGEYRLKIIDHSDAVIVYEKESPRIETYEMKRTHTKHNRWTLGDPDMKGELYKIFVPEGTIKVDLTLDAK